MPDYFAQQILQGPSWRVGTTDEPRRFNARGIVTLILSIAAVALAGWTLYRVDFAKETVRRNPAGRRQGQDLRRDGRRAARGVAQHEPGAGGRARDVTGSQAVAANARVSLYDGGQYLMARLDPATPTDLADTVRDFANNLMDIGANATAGATNEDPDQAARLKDADAANSAITELCK